MAAAAHTVTLHVDVFAALAPAPAAFAGVRAAPSFRAALWTGARVETGPVGGAGWVVVDAPGGGGGGGGVGK